MPDDKGGSDLDVFEGLGKKPSAQPSSGNKLPEPTPPPSKGSQPRPTAPGGLGPASGRGLPPPSKVPVKRSQPSGAGVDLPKPKPPPSKAGAAPSQPMALPKPKPPPSRTSGAGVDAPAAHMMRNSPSDAPEVSVGTDLRGDLFEEAGAPPGSILPGGVAADLDWDDEEESTHVFDRADTDLFGDLESRPSRYGDADDTARRNVASAAALLSKSGGTARPVDLAAATPAVSAPRSVEIAPALLRQQQPAVAQAEYSPRLSTPSMAPPPPTPSRLPYILGAVAVVALAVAGIFYFMRGPSTGDVTIEVTQNGKPLDRAQIFLDGQKRCDFSPCVLEGLSPGDKSIRVTAGEAIGQQQLTVEAGEKHSITIALGEGAEEKPDEPAEAEEPARLKVSAKQKDVKIFVNGKDRGKLPADLDDLEPGSVDLRFEGGDKYGILERTVELQAGKTLDLGEVTLPLAKVEVTFVVNADDAKVILVTEEDGKIRERVLRLSRNRVEETLDTKQPWTVKASAKGYRDYEEKLAFAADKEKLTVNIKMDKVDDDEPEKPVAATTPGPGPGPAPEPSEPAEPAAPSGQASLTVNSLPPANAIVDGRPVGSTPKTITVSPGSHSVTFIKKGYTRKSKTCRVAAGENKVCAARLKKKD